jgi:hypothetical protein
LTIATNNIKYLGVALAKQMKDLCDNNFKLLKKKVKDFRKWRDLPCSWIGINIVKMAILPKQHIDSMQSTSKSHYNSSKTLKEQFSKSSGTAKNPE